MKKEPNFCENCAMDLVTCDCAVKRPVYVETATDPDCLAAPTQGADARPVAIYQVNEGCVRTGDLWRDVAEGSYAPLLARGYQGRIVCAIRDAEASAEAKRLDQLERALVYVAHSMHSEPQYMLAEGITLGDVSFVRVKVADIDVSVDLPESVARAMYGAAMQATAAKDDERRAAIAAIAPREKA